jgi:hypothetical protein
MVNVALQLSVLNIRICAKPLDGCTTYVGLNSTSRTLILIKSHLIMYIRTHTQRYICAYLSSVDRQLFKLLRIYIQLTFLNSYNVF